jgi:D-lyxose ketol-isomerase
MKRSQINTLIKEAESFFSEMHFFLPPWAYWEPVKWHSKKDAASEIFENMLGWDLSDFGSGDFHKRGLLLFTIRNGNIATGHKKPYAEKIMIVRENQETPMHFHWKKMEDIINRGGGNLVIELYGSTNDEGLASEPLNVTVDGIVRTVEPGGTVVLRPGESICLEQGMYHRFYGEPGKGLVMVGEVSSVNDDASDNRFYEPIGRFPDIDEDEQPFRLLVNDYQTFL